MIINLEHICTDIGRDDKRVQYVEVIWAWVQKISVLYSQLYNYLSYYISNCLKKMPLLNYILL